jgi:hypothetical protein
MVGHDLGHLPVVGLALSMGRVWNRISGTLKEVMKDSDRESDSSSLVLRDFSTHASKTMMLSELAMLLEATPEDAPPHDYRSAVLEDNVLLKKSDSTRKKSLKHLRELYVLDRHDLMFAALRRLFHHDPASLPLLALLMAVTRDGLLRATAPLILESPIGAPVRAAALSETVSAAFPDRMSPITLESVGQRTASSWTQSGHLKGKVIKVRVRAEASVGAVVYALMLGHLSGVRGLPLYETLWAHLLDIPPNEIDALAFAASQRGLLEYRRMGDVAEFGFSMLLGHDLG